MVRLNSAAGDDMQSAHPQSMICTHDCSSTLMEYLQSKRATGNEQDFGRSRG
jgi:hypothetical protein